jgi:hypothetical protein
MTVWRRRQRAHRPSAMLSTRQEASASPHVLQHGGISGGMFRQHVSQTGPSVGAGSGRWHAAQWGATSAAKSASHARFANLDALGITPEPLE